MFFMCIVLAIFTVTLRNEESIQNLSYLQTWKIRVDTFCSSNSPNLKFPFLFLLLLKAERERGERNFPTTSLQLIDYSS